jgi:hydrogenase maturation protease
LRPGVTLIGVGNPWRCDDGVGWEVVAAAHRRLGDCVETIEVDGEPSRLIDAWSDADLAVIVDAVRSEADPGTIRVWRGEAEIARSKRPTGSHSLGLAHAIALGRALQRLPRELVVVGIEVQQIAPGDGLSLPVAAAVEPAATLISDIVTLWQAQSRPQAGSNATSSAAPGSSE